MEFEGKRAIVTRAASGIGRATALHLQSEGAQVWAADISADGLAETAELAGGSITTQIYDASDVESCKALVAEVTKDGAIVNMASTAGLSGTPDATAYAASKHGVVGLTKSIAVEYASKGVRVNAVAPGHVDTPMGTKPRQPAISIGR